jgi:hypothetical protein
MRDFRVETDGEYKLLIKLPSRNTVSAKSTSIAQDGCVLFCASVAEPRAVGLYVLAQRRGGHPPAHTASHSARIEAGRVLVNTLAHEPAAPFGGFKQSGIGREYGTFGIDAFLEPKSLLGTI